MSGDLPFDLERHPAASELLGSMGAGGAERFDWQAGNDQKHTSPAGVDQSFSARWIAPHFRMSLHHVALASRDSVYGGTVAASRQSPPLVNGPGSLMTIVIAEAARCCVPLVNEMVRALGVDRFVSSLCPTLEGRDD